MTPERLGLLWGITIFAGACARLISSFSGLPWPGDFHDFGGLWGSLARWDLCLMYGICVLCMGYLSYVLGICFMFKIFISCMGY